MVLSIKYLLYTFSPPFTELPFHWYMFEGFCMIPYMLYRIDLVINCTTMNLKSFIEFWMDQK